MWRIVINSFLLIMGLFCLLASCRGAFIHNDWLQAFWIFGFALALIGVALPSLFYKGEFWDLFDTHTWTRLSYAIASIGMAICCIGFAILAWGLNVKTVIGIVGTLLFGLGALVILFYDYSNFKSKYIKNEKKN